MASVTQCPTQWVTHGSPEHHQSLLAELRGLQRQPGHSRTRTPSHGDATQDGHPRSDPSSAAHVVAPPQMTARAATEGCPGHPQGGANPCRDRGPPPEPGPPPPPAGTGTPAGTETPCQNRDPPSSGGDPPPELGHPPTPGLPPPARGPGPSHAGTRLPSGTGDLPPELGPPPGPGPPPAGTGPQARTGTPTRPSVENPGQSSAAQTNLLKQEPQVRVCPRWRPGRPGAVLGHRQHQAQVLPKDERHTEKRKDHRFQCSHKNPRQASHRPNSGQASMSVQSLRYLTQNTQIGRLRSRVSGLSLRHLARNTRIGRLRSRVSGQSLRSLAWNFGIGQLGHVSLSAQSLRYEAWNTPIGRLGSRVSHKSVWYRARNTRIGRLGSHVQPAWTRGRTKLCPAVEGCTRVGDASAVGRHCAGPQGTATLRSTEGAASGQPRGRPCAHAVPGEWAAAGARGRCGGRGRGGAQCVPGPHLRAPGSAPLGPHLSPGAKQQPPPPRCSMCASCLPPTASPCGPEEAGAITPVQGSHRAAVTRTAHPQLANAERFR